MTELQQLRRVVAEVERSHAQALFRINDLEVELARLRAEGSKTISKMEQQIWGLAKDLQTAQVGKREAEREAEGLQYQNTCLTKALKKAGKS